MKDGIALLQMGDSFYEDWNIPKLMMPILVKDLEVMLKPETGQINKDILLDGLIAYVKDSPEEEEKYTPIIAVMAFEAGLDHLRQQTGLGMLLGQHCFNIARQYDPNNVEIITRQAVTNYYLDRSQFIEQMGEAITIAKNKDFVEDPFDYLTIAHIAFAVGEDGLGDAVWDEAREIGLAKLPPEKYSEFGDKLVDICLKNNYFTILNRYFRKA